MKLEAQSNNVIHFTYSQAIHNDYTKMKDRKKTQKFLADFPMFGKQASEWGALLNSDMTMQAAIRMRQKSEQDSRSVQLEKVVKEELMAALKVR